MTKSYWFDSKEEYEDNILNYRDKLSESEFGQLLPYLKQDVLHEAYESDRVLGNVSDLLFNMLLFVRDTENKSIVLSQEDVEFLYDIANKKKQVKFMR